MIPGQLTLEIAGESIWLLPERAVFWPGRRWLWVADLHWGKDASFRAAGIPLPMGGLAADLTRLTGLLERLQPELLLILGDLVHARASLHPQVVEDVAAWRAEHPVETLLIEGNHDRHAPTFPASWRISRGQWEWREGPFVFRHEPEPRPGAFVWGGHLHPAVVMGRGKERWRLPCFHLGADLGVLPAFGEFTGGARVRLPGESFVICDGRVERPEGFPAR